MRNVKVFIGLLIIGGLTTLAIILYQTLAPQKEKTALAPEPAISADLKLVRVHYQETHDGVKEWEVEAASATYYKEDQMVLFENVKATFFGKNGGNYVLLAEKGRFDTKDKIIEGFGGVQLKASDGYILRTQRLKYESAQKEIRTEDAVLLEGPDMRIEGTGLVVEVDRQRIKVFKEVQTTINPSGLDRLRRIGT